MDFSPFTTISFDCYGTLIDWESGILPVLRGILARNNQSLPDAAILELYGEFEADLEGGTYTKYRSVLPEVVRSFGERLGFEVTAADLHSLPDSVAGWLPFPDTVDALRQLKKRYKLAVISNIDDDLFAETRKHLSVEFDAVVTAERARSYKPSARNFELALSTLAIPPEQLLHAAQSIYHDVIPARSLGISSVWVNRKSARPGIGAVIAASGKPDIEVPDLATLAALAAPGT